MEDVFEVGPRLEAREASNDVLTLIVCDDFFRHFRRSIFFDGNGGYLPCFLVYVSTGNHESLLCEEMLRVVSVEFTGHSICIVFD